MIRQLIKENRYCLLYDAAIHDYLPIVKLFVENKADEAAIHTAFKWGSIHDNSVRYYLIDKLWHNSNGGNREFEEALRNGDYDAVKSMLDSEQYILNDDYQGNNLELLMEAIKSRRMFEMMIENNFDLNAIHSGRGTLLDELLRDSDRHFTDIDLIKSYGAKTSSELNVTVEMLGIHF
jgi:ankyrin repeat protein